MLKHEGLNESIAPGKYFSSVNSGYYCAQVFSGMTSKMLYVAGMKTESEFPDVYLDFIRQCGIPSALRRDNAKSEMSHHVRQIHRDIVIADQWTEPQSPWQNPAELNCVKYLKSHAPVLLDRTEQEWFSRYPWPTQVTYDRGSEFIGKDFQSMIKNDYGIKGKPITVRNPQANTSKCNC
jgi:transposase InsO family protein